MRIGGGRGQAVHFVNGMFCGLKKKIVHLKKIVASIGNSTFTALNLHVKANVTTDIQCFPLQYFRDSIRELSNNSTLKHGLDILKFGFMHMIFTQL